jgi:PAS domain S-box-containing protein
MRLAGLDSIRSISLKWKLLFPFLFFAFTGTTILVYIGLASQQRLIKEEEKRQVLHYYHLFLEEVRQKKIQVLSLASLIAEDRDVQRFFAARDRAGLTDLMAGTFLLLRRDFGIEQIHFHVPPATSYLRLHRLEEFGDDMSRYRKTIMDVVERKEPAAGLELGHTGYGIRGVVPVFYDGGMVGTLEVGYSFGQTLLTELQQRWGMDIALYEIVDEKGAFRTLAKATKEGRDIFIDPDWVREGAGQPIVLIAPSNHPGRSLLLGPVRDYSGKAVAVLKVSLDRAETEKRLYRTRNVMVLVGLVGIAISFLATYLLTALFIRPIKAIVKKAQEIAEEKRETRLEPRPGDEIGALTEALNAMLDALKTRRVQMERYAKTLERRVQERTADLVATEEKFRTLVENVPLIVYRVLPDGTTEFINSYMTESLGYTVEETVGDKDFWREKIWGTDRDGFDKAWKTWFQDGEGYRVERGVKDKEGRLLTFIDHALPAWDLHGRVKWVDGIMLDITELKGFQEKLIRTEEIRILGEISAHMAHEIRNPLSSAGGFARRLRDSLPEHDPRRRLSQIIVEEVTRLENFMKVLLSSMRPIELSLGEVDVNGLLDSWLTRLQGHLNSRGIEIVKDFSPELPKIHADEDRLSEAFENLLKHALVSMPEREKLFVSTSLTGDRLVVTFKHRVEHLSDDDIDKFFFPHIEPKAEWRILDLSFSKRIIHRHGGKVDLSRQEGHFLVMRIEFPTQWPSEGGG